MTMSVAPPHYMPAPPPAGAPHIIPTQPSLGSIFGAEIGKGMGESIKKQIKRSVLNKVLDQMNPNMSVIDKMKMIGQVDPEYRESFLELLKQQSEVQAENQRAQSYSNVLNQQMNPQGTSTDAGAPSAQGLAPSDQGMAGEAAPRSNAFTPEQMKGLKLGDVKSLVQIGQGQQALQQKERFHKEDIQEKEKSASRDFNQRLAKPTIDSAFADEIALPKIDNAIRTIETAVKSDEFNEFQRDAIAQNVPGFSWLFSADAAAFNAGSKELLMSNVERIGGKQNVFLDKQMKEMQPYIGRTKAANLASVAAIKTEADLKRHKIETIYKLISKFGHNIPLEFNDMVSQELRRYSKERFDQYENEMKYIKKHYTRGGDWGKPKVPIAEKYKPAPEGMVHMRNAAGEEYDVPKNKVAAAQADKYYIVESPKR